MDKKRKLIELIIDETADFFGVDAISIVKFPAIEEKIELRNEEERKANKEETGVFETNEERETREAYITEYNDLIAKRDDGSITTEEEERIQTELMAKIKAGKDILKATTSIAGESSKVGKAAAVSNILIDTALAISGAVKSAQAMPFPGNLAAIATGIATVMANLRTAKGILSKAGAGDGGDVSVGAVGGTPAMGGIGGTIPNINSISPDAEMQPVQAFVIENEISDAQALQEELEIQATL